MITLPTWAEWLDSRRVSIQCKTCSCIYEESYTSNYGPDRQPVTLGGIPAKCKVCAHNKHEEKRRALPIDLILVNAVKEYALEYYNEEGWDFVVETYTDKEIWEVIAGSKTVTSALRKMRRVTRLLDERRQDVRSTEW